MAYESLVFSGVLGVITALVYAVVGRTIARRSVARDLHMAQGAFTLWWFALAGTTLVGAAYTLYGAYALPSLALAVATTSLTLLGLCLALAGLLFYLVYLYTGSRKPLVPLAIGYVALYGLFTYLIQVGHPIGVERRQWNVTLQYETEFGTTVGLAAFLLIVAPQIIAAFAYFTLYFRLDDRSQRFRVAVVSWSIILWFASPFLGVVPGVAGSLAWQVTSRLIGFAAAVAILLAYQPPSWLRTRLNVRPISQIMVGAHDARAQRRR